VLDESATELPEQEIETEVFRRAPDYDTTVDPIVRVQVSQPRKKLQQYFESEGHGEFLRLDFGHGAGAAVAAERLLAPYPLFTGVQGANTPGASSDYNSL
jgi:hypothetical protein